MRGAVVQTEAGGESNAGLQLARRVFLHEGTGTVFDEVGDFDHGHARSDRLLRVLTDLAMNLSGATNILIRFLGVLICEPLEFFLFG